MLDCLENVIVSLYAKGMSNSDIEEQIRQVLDIPTKVPHDSATKVAIYSGAKYASQIVLYHH
jgi:hypothetical protein